MVGEHTGRVLDVGRQRHPLLASHRAPAKPAITAVGLLGARVGALEAAPVVAVRGEGGRWELVAVCYPQVSVVLRHPG